MNLIINPGYRISATTDLFNFAAAIRAKAHSRLIAIGRRFYEGMMKSPPPDLSGRSPMHCMLYTIQKLDKKTTEELMSAINVGIIIRRLEDWYYMTPYCEFMGASNVLEFLKDYPGMEDFSYDSTLSAPISGISAEQWQYREKVWGTLADNGMSNDLEIRICDYLTWFKILDPWMDMMRDSLATMSMEEQRQYLASMR